MTQHPLTVDPASLGFDVSRLARLDTHFERYVDDGRLTSYHLAVTRHGEVAHNSSYGYRDREAQIPVSPDTIWRIFSMTKPIVSVAAMMLWEEGLFELKDPVSNFIPEFADQKVWRAGSVTNPVLEPLMEPMRIWHLMTHTSGLTYNFMFAHPVDELYRRGGFEMMKANTDDLATICTRLASLPLVFQPGSEWNYSMSIDVLGRIVEVISGQTLDEFLRDRLFGPLGMVDTGFSVPADDAERLAALYIANPSGGLPIRLADADRAALSPPAAFLGGGGLEFTYAPAHLPVVQRSINMLLLRDLGMTEQPLEFTCSAMEETLAEKVLGFLRRSSRILSNRDGDERLVRHIHDVHILAGMEPDLVSTHRAFKLAVEEDVRKFANQDPAFSQNPKLVLETALKMARSDSQLKVSYLKFVEDLVAGGAPDFDAALSTFTLLAGGLIAGLD